MKWEKGLSFTSAGKFGSFNDALHGEKHLSFCCFNADGLELDLPPGGERDLFMPVGRFNAPMGFTKTAKKDWTTVTDTLKYGGGKKIVITQTALSPAFLYESDFDSFNFRWEAPGHGPNFYALPLKSGVKSFRYNCVYEMKKDGKLKEPWMLLWFPLGPNKFDTPLLAVFSKNPERIEITTHEFLDVKFKGKAGAVFLMPLFGNTYPDKKDTVEWRQQLPANVAKRCSDWSRRLFTFPVKCVEHYAVDDAAKEVTIRNTFTFRQIKNEWGIKSPKLAVLPPFLAYTEKQGVGIKLKGKKINPGLETKFGPLIYVKGSVLGYSVPFGTESYRTLAPVKVTGDKRYEELQSKLNKYLLDPKFTFGGDDTYDPIVIQDTMHNLRILGWALWSIEPWQRQAALKSIGRGLVNFTEEKFFKFKEPMNGQSYYVDKTIFDTCNVVDYDTEWYNGMLLRGLWALYHYGDRKEAVRLYKEKKALVDGVFNYYRIYSDWATLSCMTSVRGAGTWNDGVNYAWEGMLGLNRMAKDLGDKKVYEDTHYHLAKNMLMLIGCWIHKGRKDPGTIGGFFGREGFRTSVSSNEGQISATNVDLLFLARSVECDWKMLDYTYRVLPKERPNWSTNYADYFKGTLYPGEGFRVGRHYLLEPNLNVRSLLAHEPLSKLLKYDKEFSGQMLECFLVGGHPMALIPTDAEFKGHLWEEKEKRQTLRFLGIKDTVAPLEVLTKLKPKRIEGLTKVVRTKDGFKGQVRFKTAEESVITIEYKH